MDDEVFLTMEVDEESIRFAIMEDGPPMPVGHNNFKAAGGLSQVLPLRFRREDVRRPEVRNFLTMFYGVVDSDVYDPPPGMYIISASDDEKPGFRLVVDEIASAREDRLSKSLRRIGYALSPKTRVNSYEQSIVNLRQDIARKRAAEANSPGALRWLKVCFVARLAVIVLQCFWIDYVAAFKGESPVSKTG